MKNKLKLFGFSVLLITAIVITSAGTQQQKEKNQKEQKQNNPGKQDKKDKPAQAQKNNNKGQAPGQQNKPDNPGKSNERGNQGNNAGNNNANNNNRNNRDLKKSDYVMTDGFRWDRETFKDRDQYRKQDKVTICHKVNNDVEPAVTIRVSNNALKAHMNHGDVMGDCPQVNNSRYSDVFLRNRTDYYNTLQNHYEQVTYSQSILDYALARLTNSRQQLVVMQNNNLPAAEIQKKQATVVELEQNVSLLESLIGVAANLVVNKLL
ncbi:MAG: hypothetical protein ACR2KB_15335 [Chitinophagaceae bacterium]